jgi:ceramide glucosyltransferase
MGRRVLRGLRSRAAGNVNWLHVAVIVVAVAAGLYQLIAIVAALSHRRQTAHRASTQLPVSILKPVYGKDAGFYQAIRTHALQQYPEFEILFGIRSADDPAVADIERLTREFPAQSIRIVMCSTVTPNRKVGSLIDLAVAARHPILIVNDSDISVAEGYIRDVTAPLSDAGIGLVTCLYRAEVHDWPSRFEALAIATDFAPSTLVARLFGVSDFGLGSTLAFRRADLDRIGGFQAIGDYIADDYQLGHKLHGLGMRNVISEIIVSTRLASGSWLGAWRHQVRWARTIRLSGGAGYAGLPITYASLWVVIAALFGYWSIALALLAIRLAMAMACGWFLLGASDVWKYCYAVPLRDLWGVAVWGAGLVGRQVIWRDQRLTLDQDGRITSNPRR